MRRFLRDDVRTDDIFLVPEELPNRSRKGQILVSRNTTTKEASIPNNLDEEKDKEGYLRKGEELVDDKQSAVLPSRIREQVILDENVLSGCLKNQRLSVAYRDKNLRLPFTYVSVYFQASMIPKDRRASVFVLQQT